MSDGTAAGTHDLGSIANAASGGLNPIDLTVFHGEFLFNGTNANNIHGLWVTDGTAAVPVGVAVGVTVAVDDGVAVAVRVGVTVPVAVAV